MTVTYNDTQLKQTSSEYVQYAELRQNLLNVKATTLLVLDDQLIFDGGQKEWSDFYLETIENYRQELKLQTGNLKSIFPGEINIIGAAKREEIHFPAEPPNVWTNLPPKILSAHNGNPIIPFAGLIEPNSIDGVDAAKTLITSGFNDGSGSTQLEDPYIIGDTILRIEDVTELGVGQRILIISGSIGMFAKIISIAQDQGICSNPTFNGDPVGCASDDPLNTYTTPVTGDVEIEILSPPSANLPSGSSVTNNAGGFSNGEREGSVGITIQREVVLNIFKGILDDAVQNWEDFLNNDLSPFVSANEDQKRKAQIQAEIDYIADLILDIDSWQSFPSELTGPTESRFGDIKLADLDSYYSDRQARITIRIAEINSALGSVAQDPNNGDFSGDGVYYDYFDWFNKRCNAATGSLTQYFGTLRAIEVTDQKIADLDSSRDEVETIFVIKLIDGDTDGSEFVTLFDVSDLSIGDDVKLFDDDSSVISRTVIDIQANVLELNTAIGTNLLAAKFARLTKRI